MTNIETLLQEKEQALEFLFYTCLYSVDTNLIQTVAEYHREKVDEYNDKLYKPQLIDKNLEQITEEQQKKLPMYVICSHCHEYKLTDNTWVPEKQVLKQIEKEHLLSHSLCEPCKDEYIKEIELYER